MARNRIGDSGRAWRAKGREPAARLDEQAIAVPVVAALELDNRIALRVGAREANGAHRGFCAAVYEAQLVDALDCIDDELGEVGFERCGRAVARAFLERVDERGFDVGIAMPKEQRSPALDEVDVAVVVLVIEVDSLRAVDKRRRAANSLERAHGRIDTADNHLFCLVKIVDTACELHRIPYINGRNVAFP